MERTRSLFGPLLLIAAGTMWLLVKSGRVPSANLWALSHLWPYLLIAAGVGLILRSYWRYTSVLLDIAIVGGAFLAILYAPKLGWANPYFVSFSNAGDFFVGPGEAGSGKVISQTREVSKFNSISVDYPAQVFISQGDKESLKIEAEDNVLPGLKTEVHNNTLQIFYRTTDNKHVNATKLVKITLVVKDLSNVDFSSAGELNVDGLKTDNLNISLTGAGNLKVNDLTARQFAVDLSGAGSMTASGIADNLDMNISGFGSFNGKELQSQSANVTLSGAGSATVRADKTLNAEISGAGSVNYYGAANVTKQISGIGNVNHLNDE